MLFTYGENLGDAGLSGAARALRLAADPAARGPRAAGSDRPDAAARFFTTIASWENKGKDVTFRGETYHWSKHVNFLRFLDLPRRTPQPFELAMKPDDAAVAARVAGGRLDARRSGADLARPRRLSRLHRSGSRGEFTVAKDIYVRPRSGWFSDRSVCYLAAGKPVVTQDTGFGKFVPTGRRAVRVLDDGGGRRGAGAHQRATTPRTAPARAASPPSTSAPEPVLRRLLADAGLA